jgi:hypothetical protein
VGGKGGDGGRGEKWPKPCMYIWIIKWKKKKERIVTINNLISILKISLKKKTTELYEFEVRKAESIKSLNFIRNH